MFNRTRLRLAGEVCFIALWAGLAFSGCTSCPSRQPLVFAQMTDPQLGMTDFNADSDRFRRGIAAVNNSGAEFAVISGDLVNVASDKSFDEFLAICKNFSSPYYCVPGNHDVSDADSIARYRQMFGPDYYCREIDGYGFVFLNSNIILNPVAEISAVQEEWLAKILNDFRQRELPVVIVMHHPLFNRQIDEPDDYFNFPEPLRHKYFAIFKNSGVVAILHGHTHTARQISYDGIIFASCETTSKSFDGKSPGFRLWRLSKDGISSEYVPIANL